MKLLDGIFYQIYWAKFAKGFRNRNYKDPFGVACAMSMVLCPPIITITMLVLRELAVEYNLKVLFIACYAVLVSGFLIYFLWKKRYRRIVSDAAYNQRFYRMAAILYPILCLLVTYVCFMVMCYENQA